jgi:hypothetical protein
MHHCAPAYGHAEIDLDIGKLCPLPVDHLTEAKLDLFPVPPSVLLLTEL